jgi:hypothetical protein
MPKLIRLETGDFVVPHEVVGIIVDDYADTGDPEVVLTLGTGGEMRLGRYEDALDVAAKIAEQINAAVAPSGRLGPAGPG